jgi:hypothetical protein
LPPLPSLALACKASRSGLTRLATRKLQARQRLVFHQQANGGRTWKLRLTHPDGLSVTCWLQTIGSLTPLEPLPGRTHDSLCKRDPFRVLYGLSYLGSQAFPPGITGRLLTTRLHPLPDAASPARPGCSVSATPWAGFSPAFHVASRSPKFGGNAQWIDAGFPRRPPSPQGKHLSVHPARPVQGQCHRRK